MCGRKGAAGRKRGCGLKGGGSGSRFVLVTAGLAQEWSAARPAGGGVDDAWEKSTLGSHNHRADTGPLPVLVLRSLASVAMPAGQG